MRFSTKFKIIFKHKKLMKKKWPFEFPEAYFDKRLSIWGKNVE